jgi:hypothetical protein
VALARVALVRLPLREASLAVLAQLPQQLARVKRLQPEASSVASSSLVEQPPPQAQARRGQAAESPTAESPRPTAAYLRREQLRTTKWVPSLKRARVLREASQHAHRWPFQGPANTCRVPMHETDCQPLPRPRLHDGSTQPRLAAHREPTRQSRSTNPIRHLRSRRIAVREASPKSRPSPAPYLMRFRLDPGSLAK